MSQPLKPIPLIQTKLYRLKGAGDLIERSHLLAYINQRCDRPFLLVSAPAGFGKTTLVGQWLDQAAHPAAWVSVDEDDNDLIVFLSYVVAALQTLFPEAGVATQSLLNAPQRPPPDHLTTTLINEINTLPRPFILVLDDYHQITHPDIHQFITALLKHPPPQMHLVMITRQDPPMPLSRLRATQRMTELRMDDLRFTAAEIQNYLKLNLGVDVSPETASMLIERTEGWAVGLHLACLTLQRQHNRASFLETFQGTDRYIMEYLVDEVLSNQSKATQLFLLYTSILERFCTPLANALIEALSVDKRSEAWSSDENILAQMQTANLFVVSLDNQGNWFRYHHLFRDLLLHKLTAETTAADRAALHQAAGNWLAQHDFIDEALRHFFAANDTAAAARLVARQRYALLNGAQWQRLEKLLSRFSPATLDQYPVLLMLNTWLIYQHSRWAEIPAALERLEAALAQAALTPEEIEQLQGEMNALQSLLLYHAAVDPKNCLTQARQALEKSAPQLWMVRIMARLYMAAALQMMGDTQQAYAAIYRGFEEEETQSDSFKAALIMTVCYIYWLEADLPGMAQAAKECITLSQKTDSPGILNHGYLNLGQVCYQQNDLTAAEQHFAAVVQQPYLSYGDCLASSACGLALTYQIQGRADEARAVLETVGRFMLETGNTTLMPQIQAFQAELALCQGRVAAAGKWAAQLDPIPPMSPTYGFFWPHLTLAKVWLAQDTPASRRRVADLLDEARTFVESTHNIRFLIEVLALQALLHHALNEPDIALTRLEQALAKAQPGRFIRLFVDLGPPMAHLLRRVKGEDLARQRYVEQLLAAFAPDKPDVTSPPLAESLTNREMDVLELLAHRLTNKEIADRLYISPLTVKRHTTTIFGKLGVRNRRQAVVRAHALGLIPSK